MIPEPRVQCIYDQKKRQLRALGAELKLYDLGGRLLKGHDSQELVGWVGGEFSGSTESTHLFTGTPENRQGAACFLGLV